MGAPVNLALCSHRWSPLAQHRADNQPAVTDDKGLLTAIGKREVRLEAFSKPDTGQTTRFKSVRQYGSQFFVDYKSAGELAQARTAVGIGHWTAGMGGCLILRPPVCGGATPRFCAEMSKRWLAGDWVCRLGTSLDSLGTFLRYTSSCHESHAARLCDDEGTARAREEGETCLVFSALDGVCICQIHCVHSGKTRKPGVAEERGAEVTGWVGKGNCSNRVPVISQELWSGRRRLTLSLEVDCVFPSNSNRGP